jgi:hypothetical protein
MNGTDKKYYPIIKTSALTCIIYLIFIIFANSNVFALSNRISVMSEVKYPSEVSVLEQSDYSQFTQSDFYNLIYKDCYHQIKNYVFKFGGNKQDFDDVLHDTFIVITTKVPKIRLADITSIQAYLTSISQSIWYKECNSRQLRASCANDFLDNFTTEEMEKDKDIMIERQQCYSLYWKHFRNMNIVCRKIIMSVLKKSGTQEIKQRLGFTIDYFYKRKSACIKSLLVRIKQDPQFNQLMQN